MRVPKREPHQWGEESHAAQLQGSRASAPFSPPHPEPAFFAPLLLVSSQIITWQCLGGDNYMGVGVLVDEVTLPPVSPRAKQTIDTNLRPWQARWVCSEPAESDAYIIKDSRLRCVAAGASLPQVSVPIVGFSLSRSRTWKVRSPFSGQSVNQCSESCISRPP